MEFIFIAIIILFVLEYNKKVDTKRFIGETEPYFRFLMEDDYKKDYTNLCERDSLLRFLPEYSCHPI